MGLTQTSVSQFEWLGDEIDLPVFEGDDRYVFGTFFVMCFCLWTSFQ